MEEKNGIIKHLCIFSYKAAFKIYTYSLSVSKLYWVREEM